MWSKASQRELFSFRSMLTFTSILNQTLVWCQLNFVGWMKCTKKHKGSCLKKEMWRGRAPGCTAIQDRFALLDLHIWSSTCSGLWTTARPPVPHHGNIKAYFWSRTRGQLSSSPRGLQMCVCVQMQERSASRKMSNLTLQWQPNG